MINTIHSLFNNLAIRKIFLKLRYVLVLSFLVAVAIHIHPEWLLVAFVVSMIGELIQVWSFASLLKNKELSARGPYVLIRNPMYLGRFLLILGFVLLFDNPYTIAAYCILYYFYMVNRVKREERHLQQVLGVPYEGYCRKVGRFWPNLSHADYKTMFFFDWKLLTKNNGHWNLVSVLMAYGALHGYTLYLAAQ